VIEGEGRDRFSQLLEQGAVAAGQDEKVSKGAQCPVPRPDDYRRRGEMPG
jgi:hypothetical protein